MRFEVVPILPKVRELYAMPRDMKRFQAYLATMLNEARDDAAIPPLVGYNPMGREHTLAAVDALLKMDAERVVAEALTEAEARLPGPNAFKVAITVYDDVAGGWTHRELSEAQLFFPEKPAPPSRAMWIAVPTWTSRLPDARGLREEALAAAARAARRADRGVALTLRAWMEQEGEAQAFAGRRPTLDAAALDAARRTLAPHLESRVFATCFAGMYGDRAAAEAGHKLLGLPERAGFEVALADAAQRGARGAPDSRGSSATAGGKK